MDKIELLRLKKGSAAIRCETLKMLKWRRYGHLGGAMSIVELLSVLYNHHLRYDPKDPQWKDRDYVVLSKGHAGPSLYSTLALHGFFDKKLLYTLNEGGTSLPSHPDRLRTPGIDATTGSLGQGTSVAAGLGFAIHKEGSSQRVFLIVGDGELNEGQCWEAFQFIASYRLHEVIVIIDNNKWQLDGRLDEVIKPFDIAEKMKAFGFHVIKADGKEEESLSNAIDEAKAMENSAVCIVMDTIKAQGIPYYYTRSDNHAPKFDEEADREINAVVKQLETFIENGGT
ncbi:MAG: transketolase [Hungatella hathewayi]|uniref:transketolase n=1 Tax=Hungatella TaxID=1649459 RepID=UPI0011DCB493|nr:transketolase [Hungatella hathewayi]MDU4971226.1 transketolase [Hungatella hathewayi]